MLSQIKLLVECAGHSDTHMPNKSVENKNGLIRIFIFVYRFYLMSRRHCGARGEKKTETIFDLRASWFDSRYNTYTISLNGVDV